MCGSRISQAQSNLSIILRKVVMTYHLFIAGIKFIKWIARDKSPLTLTIYITIDNRSVRSTGVLL